MDENCPMGQIQKSPAQPTRRRKRNAQPEFEAQAALFKWARLPCVVKAYPGIDLMSCSLNGVKLGKAQAGRAKAAGMLKGEFDVRLPVARGGYIGLVIEMKIKPNKLTEEQKAYGVRMSEEGHAVFVCYSWTDAQKLVVDYLTHPKTQIVPEIIQEK